MRVVAVTGADSFLGRNLVGLLEESARVRRIVTLDVASPPTSGRKTRHYHVDLTAPSVDARLAEVLHAEDVDTVLHLAFLSRPTHATAWAHELESVGTMHLLHACRERRIEKLVTWSLTWLYGPHPDNPNFLTERHPLRGLPGFSFLADKIEAEAEIARFAEKMPATCVTVLRLAPIVGPTVHNAFSAYLGRRVVPTVMGFDPLMQFVHEVDALAAFSLAVERDAPGIFNIVGDGVLPLSTVIRLAGRVGLPLPHSVLSRVGSLLWLSQAWGLPPPLFDFLRFVCVADGDRARREMGFRPAYTTREALLDLVGVLRLREARLLSDPRDEGGAYARASASGSVAPSRAPSRGAEP